MSARFLLTGATGFIGSQVLVEILKSVGPEALYLLCRKRPSSLDSLLGRRLLENYNAPDAQHVLEHLNFVEVDFFEESAFMAALKNLSELQNQNWILIHMAAQVKAPSFEKNLQERINVGVTKNLRDWAEVHCSHLLFVSSVVAFGVSFKDVIRSEIDLEKFPWLCTQMAYFNTKRMAHLNLLKAKIPKVSIFCPSVVHGTLEEEKNSRGHLSAVRQGKLKFSPPGGINIVSLAYVAKSIANFALARSDRGPKTILLCGENIKTTEYLKRYQKLHGLKPDQGFFEIPNFVGLLLKAFFTFLKILRIPTSTSFETAVASFGFLYFSSKVLSPDENVKI